MDIPQYITDICKNSGFDYAEYLGEYKGEQFFSPMFYNPNTVFGRPRFIHVKNEKWRWSKNHDEALKVMDYFGW